MLKKVPTIKTQYSASDLIKSFVQAWYELFKVIPKKESIGVIYAQEALETGLSQHMYNNNIGNVKAVDVPGEVIEYCALQGVWEIVNGQKIILPPENPGAWFRSFNTLTDGVKFHFDLLKNRRYKSSWIAIENGDPMQFAHLLKVQGYYTASESSYANAMNQYFLAYMKTKDFENAIKTLSNPVVPVPVPVVPTPPEPTPDPIPAPHDPGGTTNPIPEPKQSFINVLVAFLKWIFHIG